MLPNIWEREKDFDKIQFFFLHNMTFHLCRHLNFLKGRKITDLSMEVQNQKGFSTEGSHLIFVTTGGGVLFSSRRTFLNRERGRYANQNTKYANQNTKYAKQNTKYAKQNTKYAKQNTKYANQNTKYANQNTKYAKQNTKYAKQNTKYANDIGKEALIHWNGPPLAKADSIGKAAINRIFKGDRFFSC